MVKFINPPNRRVFSFLRILCNLKKIINHKSIKMKQVKCADLGNDCDFVAKGSIEEVMAQVADHATGVHKMTITDDVVEAVKGVMTDV